MRRRRLAALPWALASILASCLPAANDPPGWTAPDGSAPLGGGGSAPSGGSGGAAGSIVVPGVGGTGGRGGDTVTGVAGSGGSSGSDPQGAAGTGGASGPAGTGGGGPGGSAAAGTSGAAGASVAGTWGSGGAGGGVAGGGAAGAGAGGAPGGAGCPTGAFLCEGFETYPAGMTPGGTWSRDVRGGGQIKVEAARPFSGTQAVHVTGKMNTDRANIQMPLRIDANTVFVRFMMYTLGYPSSSGVHTRLMRLGTASGAVAGTPDSSYAFASYNGTAIEKVNSIYLRNTATHLNDAAVKNRWVCWEFEIDKKGGVGKVVPHIWVDGRELALATAGSSSHGGTSWSWDPIPIELFIMGLDGFQSDSVLADFWIDDLVIHSQRVGCPTQTGGAR
jgi:hypothetical protein